MKDYRIDQTKAKRYVQNKLFSYFSKASKQEVTGLAGNHPLLAYSQYFRHLKDTYNIILVDLQSKYDWVIKEDIINMPATHIMDIDLEQSLITGIKTVMICYEKMSKLKGMKVLCYSSSTRCRGGRSRILDLLNTTLYNNSLDIFDFNTEMIGIKNRYVLKVQHNQQQFKYSEIYCYKDTSQMLSGVVVW